MKLNEAIKLMQDGKKIKNTKGALFWIEKDTSGRPILMGEPPGYGRAVKHLVFGSEHFSDDIDWSEVESP